MFLQNFIKLSAAVHDYRANGEKTKMKTIQSVANAWTIVTCCLFQLCINCVLCFST